MVFTRVYSILGRGIKKGEGLWYAPDAFDGRYVGLQGVFVGSWVYLMAAGICGIGCSCRSMRGGSPYAGFMIV